MHEEIRAWASAVCAACVCGAGVTMLLPEKSEKKTVQWILSLMMLCMLLRPLRSIGQWMAASDRLPFSPSQYENPALEEGIDRSAKRYYTAYLEDNLSRVLDGAGIPYERILVTMDNTEDGRIYMKQVEVIVKTEDDTLRSRVKRLLTPYLGTEPTVRAETAPERK